MTLVGRRRELEEVDDLLGSAAVLERPPQELAGRLDAALAAVRARNVPYLVVSGHEPDPGYRHWLAEVLPRATLTVWPGSGHFPHLAHPERFAAQLQATGPWKAN